MENGDHAVTWRLSYRISSAYRLIEAEFTVNRAAYDRSIQMDIGLNTPLTHWIDNLPD